MTPDQIASRYERDGFVVVERAVAQYDLDSIRSAAAGIVARFDARRHRSVFSTRHEDRDRDDYFIESARAVHCFLEEGALGDDGGLNRPKELAINKIGHAMHDLVPEFTAFCRLPLFAELLAAVGFDRPQLWQTMYIFKQPGIGGEVRWHQDASYLIADSPGVVGFWIAIEDADRGNGCLWVQPGGHRSPLREIYEVAEGESTGVLRRLDERPWPALSEAVPLEVPAGSLVMFSDRLPHYSSQNKSRRSRQALTLHVSQADSHWSERNWLQRGSMAPFLLS